ncbi:MAG: methionine--tRNA ligase [Candidatus Paceibacterota bacterium]
MNQAVYLTTTLPYVNADPHIGFALELVQADTWARFKRRTGHEVFFNTGTDEHGLKIYRRAKEAGRDPKEYVDGLAEHFEALKDLLDLSYDNFIRTTDGYHGRAAQAFWRRSAEAGDIYKRDYEIKYCVGCELEKTESELVGGECPLHPGLPLEIIAEENYFFRFSKYADRLLTLYEAEPDFVRPGHRLTEIKNFVAGGLRDFSISRRKDKMPWGVPVPDDPGQVMYVWFDALVNYVSAIGWPDDDNRFNHWWPVVQFAGKDNLRQQAAMWQAMLMSAGLPPSRQILIHGFLTADGRKMSKSLGNVVDPTLLVADYGTDALRYYLLREANPFEDSDFTADGFCDAYNANLANGLGNLVSRILALAESHLPEEDWPAISSERIVDPAVDEPLALGQFNQAMDAIWRRIGELDERISIEQPFIVIKTDPLAGRTMIRSLVSDLAGIADRLEPFLPATAGRIKQAILAKRKPPTPLFLRREE